VASPAIRVARKLKAIDVIDVLSDLFILRGIPAHIRSDRGDLIFRHFIGFGWEARRDEPGREGTLQHVG
jgi:hypothetical protein